MTKRMLIMLGCVLALVVALGVGFFLHIQKLIASSPKPGPQTVSTAVAKMQEWQPQLGSVGTLSAVHGVDVSSEVAGQVRSLHFKSGQDVKAGEVLVQLNADADVAQLRALQAAAELAATTLKRDRAQLAVQGVSQAQVDADEADLKSKKAQVAQQEAVVAKKTIRAPFAGRVGITAVNPGQYLNPGDKIVTLQTIDPVYIDFYLPQRQIAQIRLGQPVKVKNDAFGTEPFHGRINAISPKIDPATRNVQVQATIANPKRLLLPGMFGNATIDVGSKQNRLTLPQTAITYNPYGSTVFLVKQGKNGPEAQQAFVTTGDTRGDQVAITGGLKEGQEVVTSGQLKLKTGTPIAVNNSVRPSDNPSPTPQEH
ncbi:RND transporter [Chromobacterium violaceum]|uniref:efflux RND transporter periplasmic adaptor subunit n=1 Tax=Chromobacterium violaceum TaxID=536 RepID=UPI0006533E9D|nr:efflux RND transporter periplasmic adaptor subunit [Chromobacterium violaceum]KMN51307.1 RND transporter [Chromobacterium violaceum]KMN86078.1 RND transporter [Chromobacterium violaceum]KMN90055.1 RND transporter [Chromobacterium violaceum]KMO04642.1 RND transporter [Chromobacterium violaceum]